MADPLLIAGRALACCASFTILATTGFTWYAYRSVDDGITKSSAIEQAKQDAPKHLDNSVNLLLIGLDSRRNMDGSDLDPQFIQGELHAGHSSDVGGYNTNSLILLHIPAGGGKVEAVSVPRDDYVMTYNGDGSQQGMHKIKEAYGTAKAKVTPGLQAKGLKGAALEQAGREAGRAATIRTLQKVLNMPIDHFAEVNLMGFYDIANAVQPITVCLKADTKDPAEEGQGSGADFHKGTNTLNASQALSFVRQRHNLNGDGGNSGDFARTHRQQAFITAVEYKLKHDGFFGDLPKLQGLLDTVKKDIVIDDKWSVLDFAQQAPNLTGGNVEFNTLPVAKLDKVEGQEVNIVDLDVMRRDVKVLFGYSDTAPTPAASASPSPSPSASGTVDVYSTSATQRTDETKALTELGFTLVKANPATGHPKTTVVKYGAGAKAGAEQIAARYKVTAAQSAAVQAGHIEITLAADYAAPAPAATSSSAAAPDPAAAMAMQGPAVKGDNGIPCVD